MTSQWAWVHYTVTNTKTEELKKLYVSPSYKRKKEVIRKELIKTIVDQGKQIGIDFKVMENTIEHQRTDSECGMYSLYFIIQMLKDKDVDYFLNNRIYDNEVFKMRNEYFNVE